MKLEQPQCTAQSRLCLSKVYVKVVSSCTSKEKGQQVTTCAIICARGSFLSPTMVFPWKKIEWHPGVPLTIYNLAEKLLTSTSITSRFRKTGIHLFDDTVFAKQDYLTSAANKRILNNNDSEDFAGMRKGFS